MQWQRMVKPCRTSGVEYFHAVGLAANAPTPARVSRKGPAGPAVARDHDAQPRASHAVAQLAIVGEELTVLLSVGRAGGSKVSPKAAVHAGRHAESGWAPVGHNGGDGCTAGTHLGFSGPHGGHARDVGDHLATARAARPAAAYRQLGRVTPEVSKRSRITGSAERRHAHTRQERPGGRVAAGEGEPEQSGGTGQPPWRVAGAIHAGNP